MKDHTDLLNYIAKKISAVTYLEIGVYNPDHNLNRVQVEHKLGIDPDPNAQADFCWTSDYFFNFWKTKMSVINGWKWNPRWDLIWIDGMHEAEQVKRDIQNAWDIVHPGGVIALHDCNPPSEATTCMPRGTQREWCGNVYRAIIEIEWPTFFTVNFDYGCAVIRKPLGKELRPIQFGERRDISWTTFDRDRAELLNLVSISDATRIIDEWT